MCDGGSPSTNAASQFYIVYIHLNVNSYFLTVTLAYDNLCYFLYSCRVLVLYIYIYIYTYYLDYYQYVKVYGCFF